MSNLISKTIGVVRFFIYKILLGGKLKTKCFYIVEKGYRFVIKKNGKISIGKNAHFSTETELQSHNVLTMGNNFSINSYSRVIAQDHIKNVCNVIIGDNTVVSQDIPNNCIIAGNSNKIVKKID